MIKFLKAFRHTTRKLLSISGNSPSSRNILDHEFSSKTASSSTSAKEKKVIKKFVCKLKEESDLKAQEDVLQTTRVKTSDDEQENIKTDSTEDSTNQLKKKKSSKNVENNQQSETEKGAVETNGDNEQKSKLLNKKKTSNSYTKAVNIF